MYLELRLLVCLMSVFLSVCFPVCMSICLSVCLSTRYTVLLNTTQHALTYKVHLPLCAKEPRRNRHDRLPP